MQYRQGDVLLVRVDSLPAGDRKDARGEGQIVLARGEATGHAHTIEDAPPGTEFVEIGGVCFLILTEAADLVHQEHGTITVPPGTYTVKRQREYTPEAVRNVQD